MSLNNIVSKDLNLVREKSPLVHNITNYVVMNNTANALLAVGASPVMAHAVEEVQDMVNIASSLVINIGTLSEKWIEAMIKAAQAANEKGIPVILDPVGVGATPYRTETCKKILELASPTIIRGNASEIMALANAGVQTKGVDSLHGSDDAVESARMLAKATNAVVVVSGETDYITDGNRLIQGNNGSDLMPKVTGMGCTATAIIGAFAGINQNALEASVSAMVCMGVCGELAAEKADGPGSMQLHFLDALHLVSADTLEGKAVIAEK